MDKQLKQLGLELLLRSQSIGDEDLELLGRIRSLQESDKVKEVFAKEGSMGRELREYEVILKKLIPESEVEKLLKEYGFPEPIHVHRARHQLYVFMIGDSEYRVDFKEVTH